MPATIFNYQGTEEQIKKRSQRNKARRLMEKDVGAAAIRGKDVDHKKMIKDGGGNSRANLRVTSPGKNRGWKKG